MIDVSYWFMFPIGIVIATVAMMFGVGGAVFFSPLFFLLLKLQPNVAFSTGIMIEVFGFGSGFIGYARKKMVDFRLGKRLLLLTIPATIVGVLLGKIIPSSFLLLIFALGIIYLAFSFKRKDKKIILKDCSFYKPCPGMRKNKQCYVFTHKPVIYMLSFVGGLFLGLISSGLGEINEYNFIKKLGMHTGKASGTSVFIVMVTALVASASNLFYFFSAVDYGVIMQSLSILIFTVPGVIIGGQIGVKVASKINEEVAKKSLFFLFLVIGLLTFIKVWI